MGRYNTVAPLITNTGAETILTPNQGLFTKLTGTPPYTITLAEPYMTQGQSQGFWNATGGIVTLSTPSGLINGPGPNSGTSYTIANAAVVYVTSDGSNYVLTTVVSASFTNVDVTAATYTAGVAQLLWVNTTSNAITVTLPASPFKGDVIRVVDVANNFDTNALTLNRNGNPIMGLAENLTVSTEGAAFDLIFYDATRGWRIFTV